MDEEDAHAGEYHQTFEALVRKYQHAIVGFCGHMLGDADLGEEVAQEVFLGVYRGMSNFRQEASVHTWLFAIARKQCFKAFRDRRRRRLSMFRWRGDIRENTHCESPPPPGERLEVLLQRVRQGLLALEIEERALLLLRYDTGLTLDEMASIYLCSEATVRRKLARALKQLRAVMERMDDAQ